MNLTDANDKSSMKTNEKHAFVTGAASGIGLEIASQLAARGVKVCLIDTNETSLAAAVATIQASGRSVTSAVMDTGNPETILQIQSLINRKDFGSVDFLVNCAGVSPKKENSLKRMIWETAPDEWSRVMAVNVNGYFHAIRAVLPAMMKQRHGAIINISSLAGRRYTTIAGAAYAVSKAAVDALTRQTAGEVAEYGIRVNGVAPGRIETNMAAVAGAQFNEAIRKSTPVGRLGLPLDIANAVLFLLSDQASFITGETLVVSGGRGI